MKYLRVFGLAASTGGVVGDDWELLAMKRIFQDQESVEPGEWVEEHMFYGPPQQNGAGIRFVAYKVVALVGIDYRGDTIGFSAPRIHVLAQGQHDSGEVNDG